MVKEDEEGLRREDDQDPPKDDSHIGREAPEADDRSNDDTPVNEDLVEVIVGGRVISVDPESAAAIQAEQEQWARTQDQTPEPTPEPESDEDEMANLLFTDPTAAINKIKDDIRKEVRSEYTQDQARRDFWNDFYDEHSELADERHLVQATLDRNMASLKALSGKPARDKLAELTKADILRIASKHRPKAKKNDTVNLEGSNNVDDGPPASVPEQTNTGRPQSLGDALKQRRLARNRSTRPAAT